MLPTPKDVLHFWFGELNEHGLSSSEFTARWWKHDPDFDAEIGTRFSTLHQLASEGDLSSWSEHPRSALALIIVLDQFSRNLHRNTPAMVANDGAALGVAKSMVAEGIDRQLPNAWRGFVYMPYMHSETLADQVQCKELFELMRDEASGPAKRSAENQVGFAEKHRVIIDRFGRFPHRNEFLGRQSTAEEVAFLLEPGSSF